MRYGQQYTLGDEAESSLLERLSIRDGLALGSGLTVARSVDKGNNTNITFLPDEPPNVVTKSPAQSVISREAGSQETFFASISGSGNTIGIEWYADGLLAKNDEIAPGASTSFLYSIPTYGDTHYVRLVASSDSSISARTVWRIDTDGSVVINNPPVASDDAYETEEDVELLISVPGVLGNDYDPDGDGMAADVLDNPINGTLILEHDGSFTYTSDAGFTGTDVFTYRAFDGQDFSQPATVTMTINPKVVIDYGDVSGDGSVTAYDASLAARHAVELITLDQDQFTRADVNGDGMVSAFDAATIARFAAGLITKFPIEE